MTSSKIFRGVILVTVVLALVGTTALAATESNRDGTAIYGSAADEGIHFGTYVEDASDASTAIMGFMLRPVAYDIESVSILKDAAAGAIYGIFAADGTVRTILAVEDAKAVSAWAPGELAMLRLAAADITGTIGPMFIVEGMPLLGTAIAPIAPGLIVTSGLSWIDLFIAEI